MDVAVGLTELANFVGTTALSGVSRQALLFRTERMPASLSRAEQLRHARSALDPLSNAERARWHDLPGGRVVVSWKGDQTQLVNQAMDGLSRLLLEFSLEAPPLGEIVDLYELPEAGEALLKDAAIGLTFEDTASPAPNPTEPAPLQPLGPAELDRLEHNLSGTDMSRFARRRPVSTFDGETALLAWEERTLSIPELIEAVAPGRDARSDVWLFRRLTRVLDRRLLSILSDPKELRGAGPFSITLNVASVLSPEFLRFDASLPLALRKRVVVSFLPADIASDAAAFAFARNFARERSYRVCLRAVPATLLPVLDFAALDLDYVQLIWSPELSEVSSLPELGGARWIMGQPCTKQAAEWGLKHGIGLYTMKPTP